MMGATLEDLIQLQCLHFANNAIRVDTDTKSGKIYFAAGQVVHAVTDEHEGEKAVYEICTWRNGRFTIETDVQSPTESITRAWESLLLEAAHHRDETTALTQFSDPASGEIKVLPIFQGEAMKSNLTSRLAEQPDVHAFIEFNTDGELLTQVGEGAEDAHAAFAYVLELIHHIGTDLGLEDLTEASFQGQTSKAVCHIEDGISKCLLGGGKASLSALTKLMEEA